jgi:hypothetical protein
MRTKSKVTRQKPPADFEEVKRRFIRQNRELAKNNSTQSLRIRSLEVEVSRLLSDNLDLRNEVLHLQNELYIEKTQAANNAAKKVKADLLAKIDALSAVVHEIEESEEVELPDVLKAKRPVEGNWRERQPLAEIMQDSQMPTIAEDKLYPRRTLGAEQLQAIRLSDHSNESPDLGPPPVARFDYEDPIKPASPSPVKEPPAEDDDVLPASFAVNLETRRKRKDGQSRLEIRRSSILPQSPVKPESEQPASAILRTGAKRKLADRESEKPIKPPSKGDFTFSRKSTSEDGKTIGQEPTSHNQSEIAARASPKPARRVLGDKSVNMSPRKAVAAPEKAKTGEPDKPAVKTDRGKEETNSRRRRVSSIPLPSPPREDVVNAVDIQPPAPLNLVSLENLDPTTPAALDLFSPATSEPSAKPEGRGDTPPPADLSSLSITTDGGEARPSRRARAAVNYAEPSLVAKIRRPDKKMVDALTGLQDTRRAMNVTGEKSRHSSSSHSSGARTVKIKQEAVEEESAWKGLPSATQSPLMQKSDAVADKPISASPAPKVISPATDFSKPGKSTGALSGEPSAASATIQALMAGSRKRRQSTQEPLGTDMQVDAAAKKLEELDIYEFKDSSSPLTDGSIGESVAERPKASLRTKAQQRRHSTAVKQNGPVGSSGTSAVNGSGHIVGGADSTAAARLSRRKSMML